MFRKIYDVITKQEVKLKIKKKLTKKSGKKISNLNIFSQWFSCKNHQNCHENLLISLRVNSPFEEYLEKSRTYPSHVLELPVSLDQVEGYCSSQAIY